MAGSKEEVAEQRQSFIRALFEENYGREVNLVQRYSALTDTFRSQQLQLSGGILTIGYISSPLEKHRHYRRGLHHKNESQGRPSS